VEAKLNTEAGAMFQARNPRKRGSVPSFIKSYADLILNESDLNTK
jgi:hypothetical protein